METSSCQTCEPQWQLGWDMESAFTSLRGVEPLSVSDFLGIMCSGVKFSARLLGESVSNLAYPTSDIIAGNYNVCEGVNFHVWNINHRVNIWHGGHLLLLVP